MQAGLSLNSSQSAGSALLPLVACLGSSLKHGDMLRQRPCGPICKVWTADSHANCSAVLHFCLLAWSSALHYCTFCMFLAGELGLGR